MSRTQKRGNAVPERHGVSAAARATRARRRAREVERWATVSVAMSLGAPPRPVDPPGQYDGQHWTEHPAWRDSRGAAATRAAAAKEAE